MVTEMIDPSAALNAALNAAPTADEPSADAPSADASSADASSADEPVIIYITAEQANGRPLPTQAIRLERSNAAPFDLPPGVALRDFDFSDENLTGVNFTGCDLGGVTFDRAILTDAVFNAADLSSARFAHADSTGASFRRAALIDAVLTDVSAYDCDFGQADLSGADLRDGAFREANFVNTNLRRADLTRADLRYADFTLADLRQTILIDARIGHSNLECAECGRLASGYNGTASDRNLYCVCCEGCGHAECTCEADADENRENSDADEAIPGGTRTYPAKDRKARKVFDCTRMAGAEVEYKNSQNFPYLASWASKWKSAIHTDGSCGYECVTQPAAGDHMVRQATELTEAMRDAECKVTEDCGLHVHVDARDFTWSDIMRLCDVYSRLEPILFLFGGQGRTKSRWCAPNGRRLAKAIRAADPKEALLGAILHDQLTPKSAVRNLHKKGGSRYVALNLLPWLAGRTESRAEYVAKTNNYKRKKKHIRASDCTVEFRLHRRLEDLSTERLVGWMRLLTRIVDWTHKASQSEVDALPRNAMRALRIIAPDCSEWCLDRLRKWRGAVALADHTIGYTPKLGYYIRDEGPLLWPLVSPYFTVPDNTASAGEVL